jgi:hypothetical protein
MPPSKRRQAMCHAEGAPWGRPASPVLKLDQAEEAYRMFAAREATKIVLTP